MVQELLNTSDNITLILTKVEADELEQLLVDILYKLELHSVRLMYDSRILFDILTKLEMEHNVQTD